ncbi:MAG: histidine kinase [Bacteroidia bacterium]
MNFPFKKICLLFFLFASALQANSQTLDEPGGYRHITVRDGLPSSEVYKIFQDRLGYIWMSTDAGVCRYNGYRFESFTTRSGLTDNTVFRMTEDQDGKIWAQGFSGALSYFDGKKFNPIAANDSLVLLYANGQKNSFCMEPDAAGGITIGGIFTNGLFRVGPEDGYKKLLPVNQLLSSDTLMGMIWSANIKSKNYFAAVNHNGQEAIFAHHGMITHLNIDSEYKNAGPNNMSFLTHDERILFTFMKTIYTIGVDGAISMREFPAQIVNVNEDASGNVWISLFFGGTYMFPKGNFTVDPKIYLPGKTISGVFADNEMGYWFSTVGDGVYYLPDLRFGYLTPSEGLSNPNVQCIAAFKKHQVMIGLPNGRAALFNPNAAGAARLISANVGKQSTLPTESLIGIHDTIIGSNDGLILMDSTLKILYVNDNSGHYKGMIRNPGTGYLMCFTVSSLSFINQKLGVDSTVSTKIRYTTACYGNDGTIWLGALNGLWKLKGNLPVYMGDSIAGVKARIDGICQDKKGVLWVATRGEGVFAIYKNQKWHYGEEDGMAANTCRAIALDPTEGVWVGTNHGITFISGFDPKTGKANLRSFNSTHGLLSDEVKFLMCHDGKLWMGSNDGLSWIGISELTKDSIAPPVYITKVLFGTEVCNLDTLEVFDFSDKTIRIFIEGLCFRDPGGVRYKYRMLGGDEQWITTANKEISFAGLAPGEYRLEIVAINSDGKESDHPAVFSFRVLAPFYRTFWFISLMVLVLIGLVWVGANYLSRRKQRRAEEKAETERRIAELRLAALRSQMNPHFIFNAINSIQHFVLQNDSEQAYDYLAKFSRLIRLVLDQSQSETISLDQELKMLHLYIDLEQLRFERPFTYEIVVDPELQGLNVQIPGMLVQPFIENSIWHGLLPKKTGEAWISISFLKKDGFAEITVEDNGVGRKAASLSRHKDGKKRSYGLQITEERLRLAEHKKNDQPTIEISDMKDADGNSSGTKVVINITIEEYD